MSPTLPGQLLPCAVRLFSYSYSKVRGQAHVQQNYWGCKTANQSRPADEAPSRFFVKKKDSVKNGVLVSYEINNIILAKKFLFYPLIDKRVHLYLVPVPIFEDHSSGVVTVILCPKLALYRGKANPFFSFRTRILKQLKST